MDLTCQIHPAPGRVYTVGAEEPLAMIRADLDHWAKDKAPAL